MISLDILQPAVYKTVLRNRR